MNLKNCKIFIADLYTIINYILKPFLYLSFNKKFIFIITLILIFNFEQIKNIFLSLLLTLLFLEFIVIFIWSYRFYYFYLTNQYYFLNLNNIFEDYVSKNLLSCLYLYIKIGAFKKFYFIIKKKKINMLTAFILITVIILHIPVRSIVLIYHCIETFNIMYFLECKKEKKFKNFFLDWARRMCSASYKNWSKNNSKIEIFNKKLYY